MSVEATEAIWKLKKKAKHDDLKLASNKKPIKLWKGYKNNLGGNKKRYNKYRNTDYFKNNQFVSNIFMWISFTTTKENLSKIGGIRSSYFS